MQSDTDIVGSVANDESSRVTEFVSCGVASGLLVGPWFASVVTTSTVVFALLWLSVPVLLGYGAYRLSQMRLQTIQDELRSVLAQFAPRLSVLSSSVSSRA